MNSPFVLLYEAILQRIKTEVAAIRYVNQDLGQLEFYNARPAVSWPCVLIDFDNFSAETLGENVQRLEGDLILRLALDSWNNASSLTPAEVRASALSYFDLEFQLYRALQGWAPADDPQERAFFGSLTRISTSNEKRDDAIRVRVLRFRISIEDYSAREEFNKTAVTPEISGQMCGLPD